MDLGGLSGGDIIARDKVVAGFHVEDQDWHENMHCDGQTNDGGLDASHHSMPNDVLSEEECVSDDKAETDKEIAAAQHYVHMFTHLNLEPNEEDEENGENLSPE